MSGIVQPQTLTLTFRADPKTAAQIRAALNITLAAITVPTAANAHALFELGAAAVIAASNAEAAA